VILRHLRREEKWTAHRGFGARSVLSGSFAIWLAQWTPLGGRVFVVAATSIGSESRRGWKRTTNGVLHPGHGRRRPSSSAGALIRALQPGQRRVMLAGMTGLVGLGDTRSSMDHAGWWVGQATKGRRRV